MRTLPAPAKINLSLHVGPANVNGYHPVDTVCAFLDIGERVTMKGRAPDFSLEITGPGADGLKADRDNLILRGARAVAARTGAGPAAFHLRKMAPVASGIGAGTSDGVAAMVLLNEGAPTPLDGHDLIKLSSVLGADGPVCMARHFFTGPLIRAQGIGEQVAPVPAVAPFCMCLANPGVGVSTPAVFEKFDQETDHVSERSFRQILPGRGASVRELARWASTMRNDLAPPARHMLAAISDLEAAMAARPGAHFARMSGSGATVFGLFANVHAAARAARDLAAKGHWSTSGRVLCGPPEAVSE
ncbi:MAG: 4-(cytidine 5'-diphospho)-2-C-methyl-D-erythritol kinase [Parvularcula sp.]